MVVGGISVEIYPIGIVFNLVLGRYTSAFTGYDFEGIMRCDFRGIGELERIDLLQKCFLRNKRRCL